MASQSLYRKWRSQTFSDLVGQEAITRTLLNAVREGRLAHAYLFCGPRGTGKTSTARLLAKAVNCANPKNGEPCNECLSCREITAGRSPDVIEIDAASNTGVDNIRDLRETVNLLGTGGHYKVYVVDEVHMLSTAAFNALLKTLEEPPPHIIFVLATTEAHKVLPTVISRCQRFDFHRISMREIVARIQHVAVGEGLTIEPAAADLLARAAQGGMRDALSLLDQAMAYCGAQIDLDRTRAMLGLADPRAIRTLINHVAGLRAADGLYLINELVTTGADLRQLNTQLAEEWRALVLASAGANIADLMDRSDEEAREIADLATSFSLEELTACARVFARNEAPARGLPVPQLALELAFLECVGIHERGAQPTLQQAQPVSSRPAIHQTQTPPRSIAPAAAPGQRPTKPTTPAPLAPMPPQPAPAQPMLSPVTPPAAVVEELDLDAIERGIAPPPLVVSAQRAIETPAPRINEPVVAASSVSPQAEYAPEDVDDALTSPDAYAADGAATWESADDTDGDAGSSDDWREALFRTQNRWDLIKQVCKQKSRSVAALLHSARPLRIEPASQPDEKPVLVLHADFKFHYEKLREPTSRQAVEWAISQVIEMPIRVRTVFSSDDGGSAGKGAGGGPAGPGGASVSHAPASPLTGSVQHANDNGTSSAMGGSGSSASQRASASLSLAPAATAPAHAAADPAPIATPPADNVRQFAPGRLSNGAAQKPASGEVRDAATAYDPLLSNITPLRPSTRGIGQRTAAPDVHPTKSLEDNVRADPVIQALLRTHGVELADVRPLADDE